VVGWVGSAQSPRQPPHQPPRAVRIPESTSRASQGRELYEISAGSARLINTGPQ